MIKITYEQFEQVELRSGTITRAEDFARAKKPTYKIWADFGEDIGILQTSAQVTHHYTQDQLLGKQIVGCVNLDAKNIAGFMSQFLLVGFKDHNNHVCLIGPDPTVANGQKLF